MDFCHIAPTAYLSKINLPRYKSHLLLAHLVESDPVYVAYYQHLKNTTGKDYTFILDNSAYELYRAGKPMFDGEKMIELGKKVRADYLVLPDYPGMNGYKTIEAAMKFAPQFHAAGFKTFFVPQSDIGYGEDYISTFAWAASSPLVDYIGMSILGIPNAYGVDGNLIQRFVSRWHMFNELNQRKLLTLAKTNDKKIHCLGMTDGPNEIKLLERFIKNEQIHTWDSSAAVWAGIEGVAFDNSPTGLTEGKVKSHVDFAAPFDESKVQLIISNMKVIDNLYI